MTYITLFNQLYGGLMCNCFIALSYIFIKRTSNTQMGFMT